MHATSIPCCSHKAIIFATAESLDAYLTVRVASQEHGFHIMPLTGEKPGRY